MLYEHCPGCGGLGYVDSGGSDPAGRFLDVPCGCDRGQVAVQEGTLRERRIAKGYGMRQFAELVGLLPSRYCEIEHGRAVADDLERAAICDPLGLAHFDDQIASPSGQMIPVFAKTRGGRTLTAAEVAELTDAVNGRGQPPVRSDCPNGCGETMERTGGDRWACLDCGYSEER